MGDTHKIHVMMIGQLCYIVFFCGIDCDEGISRNSGSLLEWKLQELSPLIWFLLEKTTEKQQATGNKDYLSLLTIFNTNVKVIILFKVLFVPNKICRWQILKGLLLYSSCNVHSLFHSELLISLV